MRSAVAPPLESQAIAELLREFAKRSALRGDNPYRTKAYARAADSLATMAMPLDRLVAERRLREIPGVGEAIAEIIATLHRTGTHPALEAMRKEMPAGVLEMLSVPGLRPEQVLKLHRKLGIGSLAALEAAALEDRIKNEKGLGPALQARILENIAIGRSGKGQRHIDRAAILLDNAARTLREARPELKRITVAGDFRRGSELVGDLALVAEAPSLPEGPTTIAAGGELTVHLTDRRHYGAALLHATGSPRHIEALQALARDKGLTLDPSGLRQGRRRIAAAREDAIYRALGLPFIEPELREGRDEIERALANDLPRLVSDHDLRGILHAHTDLSDGAETLEAMAEATRKRGYDYFGVADHSISARYAGGLTIAEIDEQHRAIDRLNKGYGKGFRILKGIESDILTDGSLDYPDAVLARFDFVVASVHSHFRLDPKAQTERIIRAVAHPSTTILGHMTGRQLLRRPGYKVDVEAILKACAAHGVAVEINGNPWRLDLDWRWHQRALELGCVLSINPDAHSTSELDLTHWGVAMARKGGVPADRVLNCRNLAQLMRYLSGRRQRA
jgi:DNA polymerase (family X)